MGKGKNQEHHLLWMVSAMLLLMGIGSYFTFRHIPATQLRTIDVLYIGYLILFTVLHIWIDIKGRSIGYKEVIIHIITSSLMVGFVMIFALYGIAELHLAYNGTQAFSSLQWFFLIFYSILPALFFGILFSIFGKRDCEFGIRETKLPVSIFDQWKDETSRQILTNNIVEIYPRWTLTVTGQKGKIFKRPIFGSAEKGGIGFKLKDGRRFGYEPTSKMIKETEIKNALGEDKFNERLKDHAVFTDDEWSTLKKAISHWYSGPDGYQVIGVGSGMVVMMMQMAALVYFSDYIDLSISFIIFTFLIYFGPFILIHLSNTMKWFFIKGTIFRMKDQEEELPDWLEIKENRLLIRK